MIAQLRWRTGLIACLLPLMVLTCILFGFAAFDPSLVDRMAQTQRGGVLKLTQDMVVAGVNIPIGLLALFLGREIFLAGWRWADQIAIIATPDGLNLHRSVLSRPLSWSDISDIRYAKFGLAHGIVIDLNDGTRRSIRGFSNHNDAGPKFVALARQRIDRDRDRASSADIR